MDGEYWALAGGSAELYITRTAHLNGGMARKRSRGLAGPDLVIPAVQQLLSVRPHVVVFACTAGSFVDGRAGELALRTAMLESGAPSAVTTSGALVEVLEQLGIQKVGVATPYSKSLTGDLVRFLSESDIEVESTSALGMTDPDKVADIDRSLVKTMVDSANAPGADAVFLSCTNLPTIGPLGELSEGIGKPVLSSNLVTMASALRAAGLKTRADELMARGV
jgi:maleate isomerase